MTNKTTPATTAELIEVIARDNIARDNIARDNIARDNSARKSVIRGLVSAVRVYDKANKGDASTALHAGNELRDAIALLLAGRDPFLRWVLSRRARDATARSPRTFPAHDLVVGAQQATGRYRLPSGIASLEELREALRSRDACVEAVEAATAVWAAYERQRK